MLFTESGDDLTDRIRAAKAAGFDAVEFWRWSHRDLPALRAALDESAIGLAGILCEPIAQLGDPDTHEAFLIGVGQSMRAAQQLGAPVIIAQTGNEIVGSSRVSQHAAIVRAYAQAAELLVGSGITLAIEPLNDRVDHPGYFLTSTEEGLDIVDEVNQPQVRLLYDIYHSAVMGEQTDEVLAGRVDRLVHVHLADAPGRGEPGSGSMDYRERLEWIVGAGYGGLVGLEYRPTAGTLESLSFRDLL